MLLSLPSELLEEILLSPSLVVPDLCRVRRVCWHLRNIVDRLWTKVAMSRLACRQSDTGGYNIINTIDGEGGAPSQALPTRIGAACAARGTVVIVSLHWCLTASATAAIR